MNGKGYGMPSSHAQFLAYFSISLSLFLLIRHKPPSPSPGQSKRWPTSLQDPTHYHRPLSLPQRLFSSCLFLCLAAIVSWSRTYLEYHTPTQVIAGCAAGAISAIGWFIVTAWLRWSGWVQWWHGSWFGQAGRWRDLVLKEDLAEAGWRRWSESQVPNQEAKQANGKGGSYKKSM